MMNTVLGCRNAEHLADLCRIVPTPRKLAQKKCKVFLDGLLVAASAQDANSLCKYSRLENTWLVAAGSWHILIHAQRFTEKVMADSIADINV